MKLIIGLGNPGEKYSKTRHNAGFMVLDELADSLGETWSAKPQLKADIIERNIDGEKIILAKPKTFMNNSGEAAQAIASAFHIDPRDIWAVYDETTLPFGTLRVRLRGSSGGHNGVKSLIKHLGTQDFIRFRLGIGTPAENIALENWVLSTFNKEETDKLPSVAREVSARILQALKEGLDSVTENLSE